MKIDPGQLSFEHTDPEMRVYVVSFPKSGRTWLRVLLSRYKQQIFGVDQFHVKLHVLYAEEPKRVPQFIFFHANASAPDEKRKSIVSRLFMEARSISRHDYLFDISKCVGAKTIFLIRDPLDVMVSYYYQLAHRKKRYRGKLSDFVRDPKFGIQRVVSFLNFIATQRNGFEHRWVFYEDLIRDTKAQIVEILKFAGIEVKEELIFEAVEFASFENMKKMERTGQYGEKLSVDSTKDPASFKVRKGIVGAYREEMDIGTIAYARRLMLEQLDPLYGRYMQWNESQN